MCDFCISFKVYSKIVVIVGTRIDDHEIMSEEGGNVYTSTISTKAHNDRCNGDIHAFCMNAMLVNGVCAHM